MTKDTLESVDRFEEVFIKKVEASVREKAPLLFDESEIDILRSTLKEAGVNLHLSEIQREYLRGKQFRAKPKLDESGNPVGVLIFDRRLPKPKDNDDETRWVDLNTMTDEALQDNRIFLFPRDNIKDKGYAVIAMLGRDGFSELITKGYQECVKRDYDNLVAHNDATEARGLYHLVAQILTLASLDPDSANYPEAKEKVLLDMNTRILAGYIETLPYPVRSRVSLKFEQADVKSPGKEKGFPCEALPDSFRFLAKKANHFGIKE